ncbi:MAG: response regulator transcription factor [Bacteroidia bacterium]|jgi:DNA-binding NarL/FixJ family response regulator|nr:response regulator transcription factor [Bacteroidia bacterium]
MKITVGLVEDNAHLIQSVSRNLSCFDSIELLFVARNGHELMHKLESQQPAVLLMDIHMPEMNGIEAARLVSEKYPGIRILMHTVFDTEDKIFDSIVAGATGYLLKDSPPSVLIAAIEEVLEGGSPMSPSIARKALQLLRNAPQPQPTAQTETFDLSKRELEILEKIAEGQNYQQIADVLFVSPKTVRKHIENIYRKLQVHNKMEAVQKAKKNRLLTLFF